MLFNVRISLGFLSLFSTRNRAVPLGWQPPGGKNILSKWTETRFPYCYKRVQLLE